MVDHLAMRFRKQLQLISNFPGWAEAPPFLESLSAQRGFRKIMDVGGGANPMISPEFVRRYGIEYSLVDISRTELNKAPSHYTSKTCVDLTIPTSDFLSKVKHREFDMAFSHMFLEHIREPMQAHKNICSLLKSGGLAIHFYPSPNNLPLMANRILPEWISTSMVKIAQPTRDLSGHVGKFPAHYIMCGNPNSILHAEFNKLGYSVVAHTGFVGHRYYNRLPVVREIERLLRYILVHCRIGMTSAQLLILQKY